MESSFFCPQKIRKTLRSNSDRKAAGFGSPPSCAVLTAARHPALTEVFKSQDADASALYEDGSGNWSGQYQTFRLSWLKFLDYFFTPKTPSFAALATRNLTTVLAGILIFCCVFGLKPVRAFLFCFTSLPKPGEHKSLVINLLHQNHQAELQRRVGSIVTPRLQT
jgi:hypothetical protein